MVSRSGVCESGCLFHYLHRRYYDKRSVYPAKDIRILNNNAGFFIDEPWYYNIARLHKKTYFLLSSRYTQPIDDFCYVYLEAMRDADVMAALYAKGEADAIRRACSQDVKIVNLYDLEPFRYSQPWSALLADKKVLVVHPFAKTINDQYQNHRDNIFKNKNILPKFDLTIIKAVQSIARSECGFTNWFDALEHMKQQVSNTDFDIAIIACGAYGLPLASHIKQIGKQVIHIGGATQLLFGIKGKRWENKDYYSRLFAHGNWVRPRESVKNISRMIESGCYW
jgi:hypothetical protein